MPTLELMPTTSEEIETEPRPWETPATFPGESAPVVEAVYDDDDDEDEFFDADDDDDSEDTFDEFDDFDEDEDEDDGEDDDDDDL
jgi:hypothetical protein